MKRSWMAIWTGGVLALLTAGCQSPAEYRREADEVAYNIITQTQQEALGKTEPFDVRPPEHDLRQALLIDQNLPFAVPASLDTRAIEPIPQFPDSAYLAREEVEPEATPPWLARTGEAPLILSLNEALMVAARNSREYQTQKEQVFLAALTLDLERDEFRNTWSAFIESEGIAELMGEDTYGIENRAGLALTRRFRSGAQFTARLGLDLVKLLSGSEASSLGVFGDASVSIPLLRGSGRFIVTEPLRQAQRDVVYAIYGFERFKQEFSVQVAADYLGVLETLDRVRNAEQNYRNLITSTRRARRMADAGRLPPIQVDQAVQDELRARDRWVAAQQNYERALDSFKLQLGLPTDAAVTLDPDELQRLAADARAVLADEPGATRTDEPAPPADAPIVLEPPDPAERGPLEIPLDQALALAFEYRLDLRTAIGRIDDLQRRTAVAADALRADLTLLGSTAVGERRSLGSADRDDADFRFDQGSYSVLLSLDLPLERTAERNLYRRTLIELERVVRDLQALEDRIKLEVRNDLRTLLEAREAARIQALAVEVAQRRVESTDLFLQAGDAQIRDVLEAQESLIAAQNALTAAIVRYRVAELDLQSDVGVLEVNHEGLWREFDPTEMDYGNAQ